MDMLAGVQNREADIGMGRRHRQVDDDFDVIALQHLVDRMPGTPSFARCSAAADRISATARSSMFENCFMAVR
jgi:hypothetical protein